MTNGTFAANELPNQIVEPVSLFEAQLNLRLKRSNTAIPALLNYLLNE